jgi:exopolysaccharide production protein ExoZ
MALALLYRRGIRLPPALCVGMLGVGFGAVWWSAPGMPPSGLRVVTWGIPAALIVAGAMFRRGERPPIRRGLFDLLGDASYSIYLIHPLVVAAIIRLWSFGLNANPMWQVMLAGAALTLALSIASFYVFERPTTRAMQQMLITLATRALTAAERRLIWSAPADEPRVHVPAMASQDARRR